MPPTGGPTSIELERLEAELQLLRERYDLLLRSGRLFRKYCLATSIALVPLFAALSVLLPDWSSRASFVVIAAGISLFLYMMVTWIPEPWIFQGAFFRGSKISEATAIPDMIAEREAHIAEIKRMSP